MRPLLGDRRFALRLLVRHPSFAVVSAAPLALGIGLTTAIGSVAWRTLVRPLPYADESRTVMLWEYAPGKNILKGSATPANVLDGRERHRCSSHFGAPAPYTATLAGGGDPIRVDGRRATADARSARTLASDGCSPPGTKSLATAGLIAGLAGTAVASRVLETMLFGVSALDLSTFVAVGGLLPDAALQAENQLRQRIPDEGEQQRVNEVEDDPVPDHR